MMAQSKIGWLARLAGILALAALPACVGEVVQPDDDDDVETADAAQIGPKAEIGKGSIAPPRQGPSTEAAPKSGGAPGQPYTVKSSSTTDEDPSEPGDDSSPPDPEPWHPAH